ncbi:MAG: phosphate/phosphite/phosphonate ABC transporter substrate-binding protein [Gammaproteobacteria bacterium]|nr:phosphate/phosphite/phosphonate ABC transporter substrate-binding protein [Gammaproteobacteria bacterium]
MIVKNKGKFLSSLLFITLYLFTNITFAEETLVFSAPPRESKAAGIKTYAPIAQYLSKITGKKVVYEHPGTWPSYTSNMRHNKYDFVFDGPHFVSWRIKHLNHRPAVKIPGNFVFAFVSKKNNHRIKRVNDLIAKKICGEAPPNQGTLQLYSLLNNPMRQPTLIPIKGWKNIYRAMIADKCEAAIVPLHVYKKLDPKNINTRVIYTSRPASGQAITVGPHIDNEDFRKIRTALLDKNGQLALKNLQRRFSSPPLIAAQTSEYRGVYSLLQTSYGFDVY